jgi:uncharacterized membrane protein
MPFCSACGTEVPEGASYCSKCGKPLSTTTAPTGPAESSDLGIRENIAAMLAYVVGWLTGIVFYLVDKRPFVRFHAMQSIIAFGGLTVLHWALIWPTMAVFGWGVSNLLRGIIQAAIVICWIVCMIKAYQGKRFKLPIAGDLAERYVR